MRLFTANAIQSISDPGHAVTDTLVSAPSDMDVLTWKQSDLSGKIRSLSINKSLQTWMDNVPALKNWVYTVLSCHIVLNPLDAIEYPLPDQFASELEISFITVESFSAQSLRGKKPELKSCAVHVYV